MSPGRFIRQQECGRRLRLAQCLTFEGNLLSLPTRMSHIYSSTREARRVIAGTVLLHIGTGSEGELLPPKA